MTDESRRKFLQGAAGLLAVPLILDKNWTSLTAGVFPQNAISVLAAAAIGKNEDSAMDILKSSLDALGGIGRFVKPGQTVAIKVNATWAFAPLTASSTDPDLLKAMVELIRQAGAGRIIVVDHCSIEPGTDACLRANGLGKATEESGAEALFLDRWLSGKDNYIQIEIPNGKKFKKIGAIKQAIEADVRINMGLAKAHNVTRMSMCLKHMMGLLETPQALHTYLHQGIADINSPSPMQAQLHILEAIRVRLPYQDVRLCAGPQTEKTNPFMIKRTNQIIAGVDPVLVDAYACANFFSTKPKELAHLKYAADLGVGRLDVDKAKEEGVFRVINVGEIISTATPTLEQKTATEIQTSTVTPTEKPTDTPQKPTTKPPSATPPQRTTQTPNMATRLPNVTQSPTPQNTLPPVMTVKPTELAVRPTITPVSSATATNTLPSPIQVLPIITNEAINPVETVNACVSVNNARSILNLSLAPVAAILTGLGIIIKRHVGRGNAEDDSSQD